MILFSTIDLYQQELKTVTKEVYGVTQNEMKY